MELIKITNNGVSAKELYDFLFQNVEKPTPFSMWIKRRITDYGFKSKDDFITYLLESSGGRKLTDYSITIDMAKELAMIEKTDIGKKVRKYFIKCESSIRKTEAIRLAGIEMRKTLTDRIDESGENDRMHGHGYSNYTKLTYKLCGVEYKKQDNFRDTLTPAELKRVEDVEAMIKVFLNMDKEYQEIKDVLSPIFKNVKSLTE